MLLNYYLEKRLNKSDEAAIRLSVMVMKTRLITTIGISIPPDYWDGGKQRVKPHKKNKAGQTAAEINEILDTYPLRFTEYEKSLEAAPTAAELKKVLQGKIATKKRTYRKNILSLFDQFRIEQGANARWADGTIQSMTAFKKHLEAHAKHKSLTYFNDDGVNKMLNYLRTDCGMAEVSVEKYYKILRWFLRWAVRKGYLEQKDMYKTQPKIQKIDQPVIYLTKEELLKLYRYQIPANGTVVDLVDMHGNEYKKTVEDAAALDKTRDLFCFCAFTSLRYSDMEKLKRTDIYDKFFYTTTKKTHDRLRIDLNDQAKAILNKYRKQTFPGDLALPVITNQKMNLYLKDLGELCGFTEPITKTMVKGGELVSEVYPKYQLIGTHAARRTFICFALSNGIPPQVVMKWTGHSDYKAMKPYIDIAESIREDAMKKISDAWGE